MTDVWWVECVYCSKVYYMSLNGVVLFLQPPYPNSLMACGGSILEKKKKILSILHEWRRDYNSRCPFSLKYVFQIYLYEHVPHFFILDFSILNSFN